MHMSEKRQCFRYKVACVFDALALPIIFLVWFRAGHPATSSAVSAGHHLYPGLVASSVMMIIAARSLIRVEQAVRTPELFRWDLERAVRWLAVLAIMVIALRLLT